ncbi:FtsB family cell division protein [Parasphingopyxis marina]|uniref:Septum formation initiator family protein n=1 Tax=Parasphingopyxis marina TaxID=2761622 RepID=A0A842HUU6_9SPHN|nr:septum formation initiator family protein [Parasphingopyxis marina]MBC2777768.1 septum formation initiator family protein [Parasphingopyxis marina]
MTLTSPRSFAHLLRSAAAPALAVLVIANFAGYALLGPNGLFAWGDYARMREQRQVELVQLVDERARLANRVELLDPGSVDPDFADELVRRNTGEIREDEHLILLDPPARP